MKKLISIFCVLVFISIPVTAKAEDRSFDITGLAINAIITEDGNIEVNEELTYDFSGEFNGILRNYSSNGANGIEISKVSIRDENNNIIELTQETSLDTRYEINDSYEGNQVKIYSKSINEPKTFIIDYTVVGGVKKYEEYGELNWNFYSVENGNNVHKVDFKLALKDENFNPDILQYWYYADGGDFSTSYSEKQIEVMGYNLSTMLGVEARFQPEFLTNVPITDINIENEYVPSDEYWQYDYVDNNQSNAGILVLVVLGIGGGIAGLYAAQNKKYKKAVEEYRSNYIFFNGDYIDSQPSNLPPALINLLYREKGTSIDILPATLFYLYNKGYYSRTNEDDVSIDSDENIGFKRTTKELNSEFQHLTYFVKWMSKYDIDGVISLEHIKEKVSTEKGTRYFKEKMSKWQNTIKEDSKKLGFYTTIENRETLVNEYYDEKLKWLAYKKYIIKFTEYNDFNSINDINTLLIYGMALEVKEIKSDEFSKALKNISRSNTTHFYNHDIINDYSIFFINYHMWNNINSSFYHHNDSSNVGDSNFSSGDSFGGSFSGSDFSGGGGGGSDAF